MAKTKLPLTASRVVQFYDNLFIHGQIGQSGDPGKHIADALKQRNYLNGNGGKPHMAKRIDLALETGLQKSCGRHWNAFVRLLSDVFPSQDNKLKVSTEFSDSLKWFFAPDGKYDPARLNFHGRAHAYDETGRPLTEFLSPDGLLNCMLLERVGRLKVPKLNLAGRAYSFCVTNHGEDEQKRGIYNIELRLEPSKR